MDPLEGRTLAGTYRIDARLGSGGMGAVYSATHARTGRRYAVKILLPEVAARRDAVERFRREAEAVGALGHANVVAIHDFAESDGLSYLVMELLEGEDLARRMDRGPLALGEAIGLFEQIAAGLAGAHARGVVHRDLKPANVFLARQPGAPERAVLLDFGLAKSLAPDGDVARLTASGVVMGTPQYMAPEQASGEAVDGRADLYALATMLYEMLAGQPPFSAPTLPALFAKLVSDPAPPLSVHRPDLPSALSDVLSRGLAKAPSDRYADAAALVHAVRIAIGSEAVPRTKAHVRTPAVSPAPSGARTKHARLPWGWLLASIALVVVSAGSMGIAIALWRASRPERPARVRPAVEIVQDQVRAAVEEAAQVPPALEPEPVAPIEQEEAPEPVAPPEPRRRLARASPRPAEPPVGAPSAAPIGPPPGSGPPAGVQDAVAHMQRSDWRGCIRAARSAPRSPEILGARMSCAIQAHDTAELRATCAELRAHYPLHPQTRSCDSILAAYGAGP